MYSVSNAYLTAFGKPIQRWKIRGTVGDVAFTTDNILTGSFHLSNSATSTEDIVLGMANIGTLTATFTGLNIQRNRWRGKLITFEIGLVKANDTTEWIPGFGSYYIDSAERSAEGVTVTAYDNMRLVDKPFTISALAPDLPLNLIQFVCQSCGVACGTNDLTGFVNSSAYLYLKAEDSDIETYRDALYWILQTIGAFATIDRNGKLVVHRFVGDSVDTITEDERFANSTFAEYTTKYTALSVTKMAEGVTDYYAAPVDDGSTMNLGANPFFQSDLNKQLILNLLAEIQLIQYVPFNAEMLGGIHYDLGDVLTESGGLGDGSLCILTGYDYTFDVSYAMSGVGKNPALESGKSKTDKNLQGLLSRQNANELAVYEYMNTSAITIGEDENALLCSVDMASKQATKAQIHIEVDLTSVSVTPTTKYAPDAQGKIHLEDIWEGIRDAATKGEVTYMVDATLDEVHQPVESWIDGQHVLHLMYILPISAGVPTKFRAYLKAVNGSISIPAGGVWFFSSGTGLVGEGKWSGVIDINETVADFALVVIEFKECTDAVNISIDIPQTISVNDSTSVFALNNVSIESVGEEVTITMHLYSMPRITEYGEIRITEEGDSRYTEGD